MDIQNQVIDQLARTKGWTMFMAVMMWIFSAIMLIVAIFMIIAMASTTGILSIVVGGIYVLMAILYIFPAIKLTNFSSLITELVNSPSEDNLARALNEHRVFWKYVGIAAIFMIVFYILIIVGSIVATTFMMKSSL